MAIVFKVRPWYRKEGEVTVVPFSTGTDAEIAAMLQAYYNNELTWEEMGWAVGDTRLIHLNSMQAPNPNSGNTWAAQDITAVIVAHDHTTLASPINGHTNACITVQTRECLTGGTMYVNGDSSGDTIFKKWQNLYMRTYLNNKLLYAFSYSTNKGSGTSFKNMIKQSKNNRHTTYNGTVAELVTDSLFLPSYPEIFGTATFNYYKVTSPAEGTQFDYYATASNRIKYENNNGESSGTARAWWLGSPASNYSSSTGYAWLDVKKTGTALSSGGGSSCYLSPAWAM